MTKPMTVNEAVEVLKRACRVIAWSDATKAASVASALAALEGMHIYGSRFKVGDEVYALGHGFKEHKIMTEGAVRSVLFGGGELPTIAVGGLFYSERDCFPTREEAEAECERRNKEKP